MSKFKIGDVVYSSMKHLAKWYPGHNWQLLDVDLYVVIDTFIDEYSDRPRCLLQWDEADKKTGLPKYTTYWERLLVKIGEL